MAAGLVKQQDNASREEGYSNKQFTATVYNAGTLNGAFEGIIGFPFSAGGWRLTGVKLAVGVNTTHSSSATIGVTIAKNTDGGTTCLATEPAITDSAVGGRIVADSNDADATGVTIAVVHGTTANIDFVDSDVAFLTITEAGTGGTDPSDVSVTLDFTEKQDFDPAPTS